MKAFLELIFSSVTSVSFCKMSFPWGFLPLDSFSTKYRALLMWGFSALIPPEEVCGFSRHPLLGAEAAHAHVAGPGADDDRFAAGTDWAVAGRAQG